MCLRKRAGRSTEDPSMARVPAEKREEIISNKLKKTLGEQVLLLQPWVKDESVTISDLVRKVSADTGEVLLCVVSPLRPGGVM